MRKEGSKVIMIGTIETSITQNVHQTIAGHGAQALRVDMKLGGMQGDTKTMKKCKRQGCNNEQSNDRRDRFCSDNCGAIAMGEAMERSFAGFTGMIIRPSKPEGEQ